MKPNWVQLSIVFLAGSGVTQSQEQQPAVFSPQAMTFTIETPDGFAQPVVMMSMPGTMPVEPEQLINVPEVLDDLQLVESQRTDLKEAFRRIREKSTEQQQALAKKLSPELGLGQAEPIHSEMLEVQNRQVAEMRKAVEEILLPFQLRRLKEISARARITNEGSGAFQSGVLDEELDLSDDQKKKLAEKQQEMEARLRDEYKELRRKRQWEVIESVLTKNQQSKLKELLGQEIAPRTKGNTHQK